MHILFYGDITYFVYHFEVIMHVYKVLFKTGNYCPVRRRFG